jgi:hypothetical protein
MTTKELTALLQELEKKQRIYINELDIKKITKPANALDITLSIATLQPVSSTLEVEETTA